MDFYLGSLQICLQAIVLCVCGPTSLNCTGPLIHHEALCFPLSRPLRSPSSENSSRDRADWSSSGFSGLFLPTVDSCCSWWSQSIWSSSHHEHWAHAEPLLLGKHMVSVLRASSSNIYANQSICNLVLWVFLFKDALFHIYCWFIHWTHGQQHCNSCPNEAYITCIFPVRHIAGSLLSDNRLQYFSTVLWDHLTQWNHQQKHKNAKNTALNRPRKGPSLK